MDGGHIPFSDTVSVRSLYDPERGNIFCAEDLARSTVLAIDSLTAVVNFVCIDPVVRVISTSRGQAPVIFVTAEDAKRLALVQSPALQGPFLFWLDSVALPEVYHGD